MLPEERAREKIDRQLKKAGWEMYPVKNILLTVLPPLRKG